MAGLTINGVDSESLGLTLAEAPGWLDIPQREIPTAPVIGRGGATALADPIDQPRKVTLTGSIRSATPSATRSKIDSIKLALLASSLELVFSDNPLRRLFAKLTAFTVKSVSGAFAQESLSVDATLTALDPYSYDTQPAAPLFWYAPGDTVTGETFTGPAGRTYVDANGVIQTAGLNVKRDSHYVAGARTLLYEGIPRTNRLIRASEFDDAAWLKTNVTVTPNNTTAPDGTLTGDKVAATASGTGTLMTQTATIPATAATYSIFIKKGSGPNDGNGFLFRNATTATNLLFISINYDTAAITYLTGSSGVTLTPLTGANAGWYRLTMTATSGITSGDSIVVYAVFATGLRNAGEFAYAWGAQLETGTFATSYIATAAATVTLAGEVYTAPFNYPPQELTGYFDAYQNVAPTTGTNFDCWKIGGQATLPYFVNRIDGATNRSTAQYSAGTPISAIALASPSYGQRAEQRAVLQADGGATSGISIAGAAEVTASVASIGALAGAWGAKVVNIGGSNTQPGVFALRSFKIAAKTRSLDEMRGMQRLPLGTGPIRPVVTITDASTNPVITLYNSAGVPVASMALTITTVAGDTLVIDMGAKTIKKNGVSAIGSLTTGDFFSIDPIDQANFGGAGPAINTSSGALSVSYYRSWR